MKIQLKDKEKFNQLLIRSGFTKNAFAKETNLSQPTINGICNGTRNPRPTTAKRICEALNVDFDEIFNS